MRGFPIRTPSDQRSVGSSPRLIAASHVLHRLLVPRHPPCALNILATQNPPHQPLSVLPEGTRKTGQRGGTPTSNSAQSREIKMLASTVQFSTTNQSPSMRPHRPVRTRRCEIRRAPDEVNAPTATGTRPAQRGPLPQDPTACLRPRPRSDPLPCPSSRRRRGRTGGRRVTGGRTGQRSTLEHHPERSARHPWMGTGSRSGRGSGPPHSVWRPVLLRKEVIQPHLPVRLPCYDFVPIADPAFDGSLPRGVGPPASGVTDFRDVTGGVYKARERIHRSVADLRLLATPTSWGRVADPNPN